MVDKRRLTRGKVSEESIAGALEIYLEFANPKRAADNGYIRRTAKNMLLRYRRSRVEGVSRIDFNNPVERINCPAYFVVRKDDDPTYRGVQYTLEVYTQDSDFGGMGTEGFSLGGFIDNPRGKDLAWKVIRKWMDEGYPTLYQQVM